MTHIRFLELHLQNLTLMTRFPFKESILFLIIGSRVFPIDKPLTEKILSDPQSAITRRILYLQSMESFSNDKGFKGFNFQNHSYIEKITLVDLILWARYRYIQEFIRQLIVKLMYSQFDYLVARSVITLLHVLQEFSTRLDSFHQRHH